MTIQQLRAQIAALQDATMDENRNFRSAYDEGKFDALSAVDALLDSIQEESKQKFKIGDRIKFKGIHNEDVIRVITDIKEGEGVGFRYFFADGSIYPIGDDGVELIEEPISKDLEGAAQEYVTKEGYLAGLHYNSMVRSFKAGAKWQKEKDESTTEDLGKYINELSKQFPEVSFAKLSRIAVRVAKWQKELLMKDAIDGEVCERITQNGLLPSVTVLANGFKVRDKVKVIIIKED